MNNLILLRHGQSVWNLENKFTGFVDVGLSDKGYEEAKYSGELLSDIRFDVVFCSTLIRAKKTAEIVLEVTGETNEHLLSNDDTDGLKFNMICDPDLRERDYGDLSGLNKDETREKYGVEQVKIWRRGYDTPPPNGESLKDVVARVEPYYLKHIKPEVDAGKNVLLVAHGNTLRAMMIVLGVKTPENINEMEIATGVPLLFEFENTKQQSWCFMNDNNSVQNKYSGRKIK